MEISSFYTSWSYDVHFPRCWVRLTEFFVILGHFLRFYPTNNPESQNFEEMKKKNWKYHFTLVCHKQWSYVWFLSYGARQAWFFILHHFLSFYATTQKIKTLKKWKKHLVLSSFFRGVPKSWSSAISEIWQWPEIIFIFSFWVIFCPFTTLMVQKI